jgi:hypothetical protein
MRPLDFYRVGLQMVGTAESEAQQRTVVNRVYYGLHHEACCRYFRREVAAQPLDRNRCHANLRNNFNQSMDPLSGRIAQLLGELMRLRSLADYELSPPYRIGRQTLTPEQLMRRALDVSERLLSALERYSPGEAVDGSGCREVYSTG